MSDLVLRTCGVLATMLVAIGCCCGNEVHHATLQQAAGLAEGAPVMVSGVEVGRVQSVHVEGSDVDVAFTFDPDQHVTLRQSACALALARASDAPATLVLLAGEGDLLPPDRAVPQCHIAADAIAAFVTSLGEGFAAARDTITAFLQEVAHQAAPPSPPRAAPSDPLADPSMPGTPSMPGMPGFGGAEPRADLPPTPLPAPVVARSACSALTITVERIEPVAAMPLLLESGGWRVHFAITNGGDTELTLPTSDQASFVDRDHRAMTVANVPGDGWFMPIALPAHVTTPVTVVLSSDASTLAELTITGVAPTGNPFSGCTVHQTFTP